jgi:hypothetical protein
MDHLTNARLAELSSGGPETADAAEVAHLAACQPCMEGLRFFATLRRGVATDPDAASTAERSANARRKIMALVDQGVVATISPAPAPVGRRRRRRLRPVPPPPSVHSA